MTTSPGERRPRYRNAIVRPPGATFPEGLTTGRWGPPILEKALEQHQRYCEALQRCGLTLTQLEADPRYPDSTFVEDTAILTEGGAVLTRPGAVSRQGEVSSVKETLARFYRSVRGIAAPGTLEGGDVCEAGRHVFLGISHRTNQEGARQLAGFLAQDGYTTACVDIRGIEGILHLKSGIAYLGDNRLALIDALAQRDDFRGYDVVRVEPSESYGANCLRVNEHLLLAEGYPRLQNRLSRLDYSLITLDMSEFRKMDGGLSCLSLRF